MPPRDGYDARMERRNTAASKKFSAKAEAFSINISIMSAARQLPLGGELRH